MAAGLNIGHLPVSSAYIGGNALSKIYLSIVEVFSGGWTPSDLFAAGEQGVWYDPSDWTTLFQNAAGTIPVTAIEQPVGLMLDKSKNGVGTNGAFRYNLLVNTDAPVTQSVTTVSGLYLLSFYGTGSVQCSGTSIAVITGSGINNRVWTGFGTTAGTLTLTISGAVSKIQLETTIDFVLKTYQPITTSWSSTLPGNHASQPTTTSRPILRNRYNQLVQTATLSTQNVTTRATSHKLSFSGAGTITLSGTATGTFSAGTNTFTATAGTLTLTVSGTVTEAMLTEANDGNVPYQWVTTGNQSVTNPSVNIVTAGYDTDVTKFPPYLFFDGVDDSLATANIDFSATDKMSVFAGVRKLSDAAIGMFCEFGTNGIANGAFYITAPNGVSPTFGVTTSGYYLNYGNYPGNTSYVLTGLLNLVLTTGGKMQLRLNAATATTIAGGGGNPGAYTGAFANLALYIGRRAGTTFPFNGRIYSFIVRGALTSTPQLQQTETWVNSKTGAY